MSPSQVCLKCYRENNKAVWLSYLTCVHRNEHAGCAKITVVISESRDDQRLIQLRSAKHPKTLSISNIQLCRHNVGHCPKGEKCMFAHSEEELDYWRWKRAKAIIGYELSLVPVNAIKIDIT